VRCLATLGATCATFVLTLLLFIWPASAQGQPYPYPEPAPPSEIRAHSVVAVPPFRPSDNPWHDVRPLLGAMAVFALSDTVLSTRLSPKCRLSWVVFGGGLALPLIDFAYRLYGLRAYEAAAKLGGRSRLTYATLGTLAIAYGLWRTVNHARRIIRAGIDDPAPTPRLVITPYAASGVFGVSVSGSHDWLK
jgi:hypothetical protein